jgi:hypothetical protein
MICIIMPTFWKFLRGSTSLRGLVLLGDSTLNPSSPAVLSMWPSENNFHIQVLVIYSFMYSFATLWTKLKQGQQQIRGRLLIANHLDQSLWWGNQKHWEQGRSYLLHSFLQVHWAAGPFTRKRAQLCWAKTILLSQTGSRWIFFIQFYCLESHTEHPWRCSHLGLCVLNWSFKYMNFLVLQIFWGWYRML